MTLAKEIMTAAPVTLTEDMTLREATTRMARRKVSGAPVLDSKDRLVGILSEHDILEEAMRKVGSDMECPSMSFLALPYERMVRNEAVCRRYKEVGDVEVGDVMNDEVVTVNAEDTLEKALEIMIRFEVNRLPVVDNDGRLVGIIARQDILLAICRAIEGCSSEVQYA